MESVPNSAPAPKPVSDQAAPAEGGASMERYGRYQRFQLARTLRSRCCRSTDIRWRSLEALICRPDRQWSDYQNQTHYHRQNLDEFFSCHIGFLRDCWAQAPCQRVVMS